MQARRSILVFTILLSLACLYQISFSFFTNKEEAKASKRANTKLDSITRGSGYFMNGTDTLWVKKPVDKENILNILEENEIRRITYKAIYPLTGKTYAECKANEMALGLDLKGGMSVTLEISYPSLVENLSGKSKNPVFTVPYQKAYERSKTSTVDFITLFEEEFNKTQEGKSLATIFAVGDPTRFDTKMTNQQVFDRLRKEAKDALDRTENIISNRINKFGVTEPNIQKQPLTGRLLIELPGVKDKLRVRKLLQTTASLEFWETYNNSEAYTYIEQANKVLAGVLYNIEDADTTAEVADTTTAAAGDTTLATNNPGDTTKKDGDTASSNLLDAKSKDKKADTTAKSREEQLKQNPLFRYLQLALRQQQDGQKGYYWENGSRIGMCQLQDTNALNTLLHHPALATVFPTDMKLMWGAKPEVFDEKPSNFLSLYVIKVTNRDGAPALEGKYVIDASQQYDQVNASKVTVNMQMDNQGADIWARLTRANRGKAIAIVLDNVVYSAPMVENEIPNGSSVISGNFTIDEATDLANILKAGSLPARAKIVDEAIVGPTLGSENISSGFFSFVASFILILIYMILFYNKAGLVANIALIANVFFLMGALASVGATLTLPGIAGIVLTMGMAVDGNVLIYERIKEILREGKPLKTAIDEGFRGSYATIIDANVTNLLIAIVLGVFGTGPIRGFAVTLIIGIFTSVFCSIFITRLVVTWFTDRKKNLTFSFKWSEKFLSDTSFDFVKRRKVYYAISGLVIIAGCASLAVRGLDRGVEFTGGRTYIVNFIDKAHDFDKVRTAIGDECLNSEGAKVYPEVKMIENKFKAKITTKYMIAEGDDRKTDSIVDLKVRKGLAKFGLENVGYKIEASRKIDPVISAAFIKSAIISVVLSIIIMFLYIMLRFQKWQYGLGTAVALMHDVIFVLGMYSLLYGILPFSMEVDQAFIAAILTIMGYSINDTVVVFDRIREYLRMGRKESQEVLINEALNSTLSRTVNNSITIAVVLFAIFFFGPESIKGFTFALMVGVVVGTYSSVCIATPILVDFQGKKKDEVKK
ncbi:MAG TPA: protein translocase subunit SecDF [Flavobacteriales bacterium]|nr:protein translocase subunit SecDF [Flavobacteriales bacterium]